MRLSALLFCCLCFQTTGILQAQPTQTTKDVWQLVPPDGVGLVTLQVKSIIQDESLRMMPWEVFSAVSQQQYGVDLLNIERVDIVACTPGVVVRMGGMVTFVKDLPADFIERFEKQEVKETEGVEIYTLPGNPDLCFHKRDSRHLIVGSRAFVLSSVKSKIDDGPLRKMATGLGEPGLISIAMAIEPVRELLTSSIQSPPIPGPLVKDVETIATKSDMLAIKISLGSTPSMATMIQTKSPSDGPEVSAAINRLVKVGTGALIASVQQQTASAEGRLPKAAVAYLQRFAPELEKNLTFKVNGNRLLVTLDGTQMVVGQMGIAAGLLLPAVQAARDAARGMQSQNNLKQIVLAHLNFESTYKKFPLDKDIQLDMKSQYKMEPNLSWRVHILPYIEQLELYRQFHMDEPWDSPHNIKLLERMPDVYRHPQANTKPGYTVYQQPTGKGLFQTPGRRIGMSAITDGTSNSVCVIETKDEVAVPWTKPGDVNPMEDLSVLRNERGFYTMVFVDGSVHRLPATIDPEVLKALFTISGGEVVNVPE